MVVATSKPKITERRKAVANLYVTIKMQGVGWNKTPLSEADYQQLCAVIVRAIAGDGRFVGPGKTVSVQIRGFDPVVKEVMIREGFDPSQHIVPLMELVVNARPMERGQ